LFPLYLSADEQHANFAPDFIDQFATETRLTWQPLGSGDLVATFGPEDLLAYIYALFHSPSYRDKYAGELRGAFPKVLMPKSACEFVRLSKFGSELIQLHLLRSTNSVLSTQYSVLGARREDVESFRAGGYIALKKWLQPKHRSTSDADYSRIVAAITRTVEIMSQIDGIAT
jgi:predicted helicase